MWGVGGGFGDRDNTIIPFPWLIYLVRRHQQPRGREHVKEVQYGWKVKQILWEAVEDIKLFSRDSRAEKCFMENLLSPFPYPVVKRGSEGTEIHFIVAE